MQVVKIILGILLFIIVLALVIALFVKKEYSVEREIIINKPKQEVYNYIKFLKNQYNYSKWQLMDPNVKSEFIGTDATVGFTNKWESENKNVGKGEQTITGLEEGKKVTTQIHFIKPMDGLADAYMITDSVSASETKVKWGFSSKMAYPFNLMRVVMNMEKMIGNDFSIGLTNLKNILEKK